MKNNNGLKYTSEFYMEQALKEAHKAKNLLEVPIGCVIVKHNSIIARGHNLRESKQNALFHAEMIAIQRACKKLKSWRLDECQLYVTLEPCYMCAGAIIQSRIQKVYFGAKDPKGGAVISKNQLFLLEHNHKVEWEDNILEAPCRKILKDFFKELRETKG